MDKRKDIFDKIGSLIPGYRGYAERDGRRNCDKLLRVGLADKIAGIEKALYERINEAIKNKDKELMHSLEDCRKQLNTFNSKVRYAPYGESSFFADGQIKEDELLNIYQLDLDLAEDIKALTLKASAADMNELVSQVKKAQKSLENRNNYISEF